MIGDFIVAVWAHAIEQQNPEVSLTAFIDDRTMRSSNLQELIKAAETTVEIDEALGQTTNVSKSAIMASTEKARKKVKKIRIKR